MRSFCHDVVEIHLYYAMRHAAFAGNLPANCSTACVPGVRSKKTDAVIAPVIGQAAVDQMHFVNMLMDRKKFDCGYTQTLE